MGVKYLWDTNIAIYYLQQQFPPQAEKFMDQILEDNDPSISVITEIELLCWKTSDESDLKTLRNFIKDAVVFELENQIKLTTAAIRKTHKVKLPDAIIAATAIAKDVTLLTRNTKDFEGIDGLSYVNQHDH
jgi:predicted nucleic acid-binding protein